MCCSFDAIIFCLFDQGLYFRDVFPLVFNGEEISSAVMQLCSYAVLRFCGSGQCPPSEGQGEDWKNPPPAPASGGYGLGVDHRSPITGYWLLVTGSKVQIHPVPEFSKGNA
jgi:hypothetical protein